VYRVNRTLWVRFGEWPALSQSFEFSRAPVDASLRRVGFPRPDSRGRPSLRERYLMVTSFSTSRVPHPSFFEGWDSTVTHAVRKVREKGWGKSGPVPRA
jgi:hypothetical protein